MSALGISIDNPSSLMSNEHDFAPEAKLMFDAIKITGERFGLGMPVAFLTGSVKLCRTITIITGFACWLCKIFKPDWCFNNVENAFWRI